MQNRLREGARERADKKRTMAPLSCGQPGAVTETAVNAPRVARRQGARGWLERCGSLTSVPLEAE